MHPIFDNCETKIRHTTGSKPGIVATQNFGVPRYAVDCAKLGGVRIVECLTGNADLLGRAVFERGVELLDEFSNLATCPTIVQNSSNFLVIFHTRMLTV